jgi:tetratricopeptide (TPR) repeat protein
LRRFLLSLICFVLLPAPLVVAAQAGSGPSAAALDLFRKGTEALHANRPDEAVEDFQQVTRESPRFAEAYLNLGLVLSQMARNEEAAQALEKGIQIKPSMRGAHLFLAISEYRIGRFSAAADAIRKETGASPGDAQAWMWQGIVDLALGRLAVAVEDLGHASTLDPKNVDILYHRGHAALALSRASYETMFKLDPHSWHVSQVLAEADVESGNDTDAIEQYKATIAVAPPQSGLYEALGSALWRTGKYPEAQQAYEQAVKIDPGDIVAVYKLGCLRIDRGDAAGGKPLLERVEVADPSLTMTSYYLGRAEIQLGNNDAAIADLKRTIEEHLDEDTTKQAYFQLARVYRRTHEMAASEQAQAEYRLLDQRSKAVLQEKLKQKQLRGDRDTSIPTSLQDAAPTEP